jgi:hypothetical protein
MGVRPLRLSVLNDVQLDQLLPDHIAPVQSLKPHWAILAYLESIIRSAHDTNTADHRHLLQ